MAHLRRDARDGHSSATPVARRLKRPTRMTGPDRPAARGCAPFLFGFAPGGVCRAVCVAANAVRSYRTFSPLPRKNATHRGGLLLCGTVPGCLTPAGRYPAPFVRGARTFLPRTLSSLARAAVQPTDALGMVRECVRVKAGTGLRPAGCLPFAAPAWACGVNRSAHAASLMSRNRPRHRRARA